MEPSILKLKDRSVHDNSKEIVKVVDFNEFVLRYVCNIGKRLKFILINVQLLLLEVSQTV